MFSCVVKMSAAKDLRTKSGPIYWVKSNWQYAYISKRLIQNIYVVCLITIIGAGLNREPGKSIFKTTFNNAESIALVSAGIIFLLETGDRQKRNQYEAWQVINSAQSQTGSGGRIQALEDLLRDGVDLEGVSASGADLSGINLESGQLSRANLARAHLDGANLKGANLEGARLTFANLEGANLREANLEGAELGEANLQNADLKGANLEGSIFLVTDLRKTRGLNLEALNSPSPPLLCNSPLPSGIEIKGGKDRDCDQMASVLLARYPEIFINLEDAEDFVNEQCEKNWD